MRPPPHRPLDDAIAPEPPRGDMLLECAPALIHTLDADGRFESVNAEWLATLGYAPEEVLGQSSTFCLTEASRDRAEADLLPRLRAQGRVSGITLEVRCRDGRALDLHVSAVRIVDRAGRPGGALVVSTDETEHAQLERSLADSEERMRMALDSGRIVVWSWDLASDTFEGRAFQGAAIDHGEGRNTLTFAERMNLVHPDDRTRVEQLIRHAVAAPLATYSDEFRLNPDLGDDRWYESRGRVYLDASGKPERVVSAAFEVTARKRAEREAAITRDALMSIARLAGDTSRTIDEILHGVLQEGAFALRVPRGNVWWLEDGMLRCIAAIEPLGSPLTLGMRIQASEHASYFDGFRHTRVFAIEDARRDPRVASMRHDYQDPRGIGALLDAPILEEGHVVGLVCFEHVGDARSWSADAQTFAVAIAETVARALASERRRRAERELADAYRNLQVLTRRLEQAREDERRHIAHELHDELGQNLTAIRLGLEVLADPRPGDDRPARFAELFELVERGIRGVRDLSHDLRPPLLDELGLVPALRAHIEQQQRRSGIAIAFEVTGEIARGSVEMETVAFRIVQEALTNVVRHAEAQRVTVTIASGDRLELTIRDDGRGFDGAAALASARDAGHLGVWGMQERARFLGGRVEIESHPGAGTTVRASLPGRTA